jgi:large subunit ribosomal protein L30
MTMAKKIRIKQIKSDIGNIQPQKKTLVALGLRRIGHSRVFNDSSSVRGMIETVKHLVTVEEVKEGGSK